VNARSIGIEIVNPGHEFGYIPFAEAQIAALIELAHEILQRHPITPKRVIGHSDIAPARKADPGELFPWRRLAGEGVGVWSKPAKATGDFAANLARFGYGLPPDAEVTEKDVIIAFQRHFRPARIDGIADDECEQLLSGLLA